MGSKTDLRSEKPARHGHVEVIWERNTPTTKRILQAHCAARWNVGLFVWLKIGAILHKRRDIYDSLSDYKLVNDCYMELAVIVRH